MIPTPLLLETPIKNYPWGSKNKEAYIPRLIGLPVEKDIPYAEAWMGVHPNAPSRVSPGDSAILLSELIRKYPEIMVGSRCIQSFGATLPFLFKILSASRILSIQVHPDKKQAERLHAKDPGNYPDDNHKPEIAVAIDELSALAGFRSEKAIRKMLEQYPEIMTWIGRFLPEKKNESIRFPAYFKAFLAACSDDPSRLMQVIVSFENRLKQETRILSEHERLFLDLRHDHPGPDIGLFALFFLEFIHLKQGEGIFIGAGIPHAYIKGNIIECMANSDNVVRAGLTNKFQDIGTLSEIVKYEAIAVPIIPARPELPLYEYPAPCSEFSITRMALNPGLKIKRNTNDMPSIFIGIEGGYRIKWLQDHHMVHNSYCAGQAVFIPAALDDFEIEATDPAVLFCASPRLTLQN